MRHPADTIKCGGWPWKHPFSHPPSITLQAFAEHIRFCANKLLLGVNYMSASVPCYDRVVEMQALNEALRKAFPELSPNQYPWPGHQEKGKPGTGWVASPATRSLDLRDPVIDINKMVRGVLQQALLAASAYRRQCTLATQVASIEAAERRAQGLSARPASAQGRPTARPNSARTQQGAAPAASLVRPATALHTRPSSGSKLRFASLVTAQAADPVAM